MKQALLAPLTLLLLAFVTPGQSTVLNAKHLSKADNLVIQFESFETFAHSHPDTREYSTRTARLSESLTKAIGHLPESDIRTDLATAVYFYELGANAMSSQRDFLLRKARSHVSWAKANVALQRGETPNVDVLQEMKEQHQSNEYRAQQALTALKRLESEVVVYSSLGEFEEEPTIARVPYETFQQHLRETVIEVRGILSWLPRNRLRAEISNALGSYEDGAFWWERVYQPRVINVSSLVAETTRAPVETAYLVTVPYTIIINWRNAGRSLRRAEALLPVSSLRS